MAVPVLIGPRVTLRPPRPSDLEERRALGRRPEIARGFGAVLSRALDITEAEAAAWFAGFQAEKYAWVMDQGGHFIGTLVLHSVDPADGRASVAIGIFDENLLDQGFGTEALQLALGYAFATLGLHRVNLRVLASNARAIRSYEKCGFQIEGRERESARVGDVWEDDLIMGLLHPEWAQRLARLGGTEPQLERAPRRRAESA